MKCGLCNSELNSDILILEDMPAQTFGLSEETVTLNIAKCNGCGVVQLVDVPLSENFREVYRSIASMLGQREKKKDELYEFIEKYELQEKEFFELGCGDGQYLDILKELDIEADGYEAGIENKIKCEKKGYWVLDNLEGSFDQKYDVILSFFFLEHIPDPVAVMQDVMKKLNPNGMIYFELPNYGWIKKEGLWLEFTRDHRFYYNTRAMTYLLQKVGFKDIKIDDTTLTLKVTASKPDAFANIQESIYNDIKNFNKLTSELGEYAIVGAGHWTQALLSQITHKPKYIFDSVQAKIGKKLCGIEIQWQGDIINCPCDNIIVSCGDYNAEAKKNIERLVKDKNIIVWGVEK